MPTRILVHILVIGCSAGLGFGVGIMLRQKPAGNAAEASIAADSSTSNGPVAPASGSRPPAPRLPQVAVPLPTQLERDLSMSRGVTNWLYWMDAIEKASPADYPQLVTLAENNSGAMRLLTDRWIDLDPRGLFDTLVAATKGEIPLSSKIVIQLSRALLREWTKRDPEAVLEALNSTEDFGMRGQWRREVAVNLVEHDAELGLRLMSEWNIDNHGPRMNAIAKWAAANPRHAAEFALAHPAGYATQLTMETIGKEWARIDPVQAMEFSKSTSGAGVNPLAKAALQEWAGRNLNEAANWLTGTDAQTRNRFSAALVEAWAREDTAAAMAWSESNLSGSSLVDAISGVISGTADKDVTAAAQLVAASSPSLARAEAAVAVARKWFPNFSDDKSAKPEAVAWLAGLDTDSIRRVVEEIQWSWATSDPQGMASFLSSLTTAQISPVAYNVLARQLARKDPAAALAWASQLPSNRKLAAGGDAFSEWNSSQPEAAMTWLRSLALTDPRRQPFLESAIRSMVYDLQGAERLAALPAPERAAARNVLNDMKLPDDRRARLLEALKMP